jgi:hypothetical protein
MRESTPRTSRWTSSRVEARQRAALTTSNTNRPLPLSWPPLAGRLPELCRSAGVGSSSAGRAGMSMGRPDYLALSIFNTLLGRLAQPSRRRWATPPLDREVGRRHARPNQMGHRDTPQGPPCRPRAHETKRHAPSARGRRNDRLRRGKGRSFGRRRRPARTARPLLARGRHRGGRHLRGPRDQAASA